MEKERLRELTRQVSRMYALLLIHIVASVAGLALNYMGMNNPFVYYAILFLNLTAVWCFEPWKIISWMNDCYGYRKGLEAIEKERAESDKR